MQIPYADARSLYSPCMMENYETTPVTWTTESDKCLRWDHQHITYYVVNRNETSQYYNDIIDSSFQEWQRATDGLLTFGRTSSPTRADIYIVTQDNDGTMKWCKSMMVVEGCAGLDYTGRWIEKGYIVLNRDGLAVSVTMVHEIGHTLALDHTLVEDYNNPIDMMYCCGMPDSVFEISYLNVDRLNDIYKQ